MMLAAEALRKSVAHVRPPYWQGSFKAEIHETSVSLNFTEGEPENNTYIRNTASGIEVQTGEYPELCRLSLTAKPIVRENLLLGVEFFPETTKGTRSPSTHCFWIFTMKAFHESE
ncbi:MAG: hypothetical protein MZV49_09335 [Rhodopseudomonas palustris]|nr:hypothetical protein [Rhodopseudomonas palustris]